MKKIAFSDKYGLTDAVIQGRKTMTRRIIPDIEIDWVRRGRVTLPVGGFKNDTLFMDVRSILRDAGSNSDYSAPAKYQPRYERGEEVAVAQRYKDCGWDPDTLQETFVRKPTVFPDLDPFDENSGWIDLPLKYHKGWTNKMFVLAGLMPHSIIITDVNVERLQDISDEDCIKEGIRESRIEYEGKTIVQWTYFQEKRTIWYNSPREAFAALIDRICGRGTWERNPWVFAYSFKVKHENEN